MDRKYEKENKALVITALTNARNVLKLAIQYYVPTQDLELAFNEKAFHKTVAGRRAYRMRFLRLYRDNDGNVCLECTGYESEKHIEKFRPRIMRPWHLPLDAQEALYAALSDGCYKQRKKTVGYDRNGNRLSIGDTVLWHDPGINDYPPEDRIKQAAREWEICRVIGDIIVISDNCGDAEVFDNELEKIK